MKFRSLLIRAWKEPSVALKYAGKTPARFPPRAQRAHYSSNKSPRSSSIPVTAIVSGVVGVCFGAVAFSTYQGQKQQTIVESQHTPSQSTAPLSAIPPISYDDSQGNLDAAREEMIALLGNDRVNTNLGDLISRSSTSWSAAPHGDRDRPVFIVFPKTTEEVSSIAKICHRRRIPMIAFSGGTSLEGTLAAVHGGICVDFNLMNQVVALHKDDMDVVVQPALGYEQLNEILAADDLFFPPDPGPGAQIGGMIAQGCSGTNAYRYGTMKDWVLGLTVVLADGTIIKTRHRPKKSSSGLNLTQLMVGSEGQLGFVTEASLKITSKPTNERVAVISFPNTQKAVDLAVKIVQNDLQLRAMELLCDVTMKAVNQSGYCDKEYAELPTLFLKFAGSKGITDHQIEQVEKFAKECSSNSIDFSETEEEAESLWGARKTALWSCLALKNNPSDQFLSADSAVPISKLAEAIETAREQASKSGFICFFVGHVGDGNFHTGVLYPAAQQAKAEALIKEVQRNAIKLEGTVTGEHGIGFVYRDMVVEELGQPAVDTMRQIKLALDPLCLLNPDKLFRLNIKPNQS